MQKLRNWTILVLGVVLIGLTSCSNEPSIKTVSGMYQYKLSGSVRIYYQEDNSSKQVHLNTENGIMTIVRDKDEADQVKITMSADNGDLYSITGVLMHDTIFFEPVSRDIYVDEVQEMFRCQMNGEGQLLSDGSISARIYITGRAHEEANIHLTAINAVLYAVKMKD